MTLAFEVLSGGTITIDTIACPSCESKACAKVCAEQSPGPVLVIGEDGRPRLKPTLTEVKRGVCTECLGCLVDCEIRGRHVVGFHVPLPGLEAFITSEAAAGRVPVYQS